MLIRETMVIVTPLGSPNIKYHTLAKAVDTERFKPNHLKTPSISIAKTKPINIFNVNFFLLINLHLPNDTFDES